MNTITYTYRGPVERGNGKPGYDWHDGYSETTDTGAVLYPWMTFRECQQDARKRNACAVFVDERGRTALACPSKEVES